MVPRYADAPEVRSASTQRENAELTPSPTSGGFLPSPTLAFAAVKRRVSQLFRIDSLKKDSMSQSPPESPTESPSQSPTLSRAQSRLGAISEQPKADESLVRVIYRRLALLGASITAPESEVDQSQPFALTFKYLPVEIMCNILKFLEPDGMLAVGRTDRRNGAIVVSLIISSVSKMSPEDVVDFWAIPIARHPPSTKLDRGIIESKMLEDETKKAEFETHLMETINKRALDFGLSSVSVTAGLARLAMAIGYDARGKIEWAINARAHDDLMIACLGLGVVTVPRVLELTAKSVADGFQPLAVRLLSAASQFSDRVPVEEWDEALMEILKNAVIQGYTDEIFDLAITNMSEGGQAMNQDEIRELRLEGNQKMFERYSNADSDYSW